jgi:hypothetical protein
MTGWIEAAGDDARSQAAVGGQDLVGTDHGEPVAQRDRDPRVYAGELARQQDMFRHDDLLSPVDAVVPVHAEQVQRVGRIGINGGEGGADPLRDLLGVGKLGEGGEENPRGPEPLGGSLQDRGVGELTLNVRSPPPPFRLG